MNLYIYPWSNSGVMDTLPVNILPKPNFAIEICELLDILYQQIVKHRVDDAVIT